MSDVLKDLLAFANWFSWMADPAVWITVGGAALVLGAVWVVARARYQQRWSGPQYRRNS